MIFLADVRDFAARVCLMAFCFKIPLKPSEIQNKNSLKICSNQNIFYLCNPNRNERGKKKRKKGA